MSDGGSERGDGDPFRISPDSHVAVEIADADARVLAVNHAWEQLTGYTAQEARGIALKELVRSDQTDPRVFDEIRAALETGRPWSGVYIGRRKDGSSYPQAASIMPVMTESGELDHVISHKTSLEHTSFDRALELLDETREALARDRFQALMDAALDAVVVTDWETALVVEVNQAACDMFGYTAEEFSHMTGRHLAVAEAGPELDAINSSLYSTGRAYSEALVHRRKDGSQVAVEVNLSTFVSRGTKFTLGIFRDVTERVTQKAALLTALEDLRQADVLFRTTFERAPAGLAVSKQDGILTSVNPAFCKMLGYERDELIGASVRKITHPDDVAAEAANAQAMFAGEIDGYALEKRYVGKNGRVVASMMHIARVEIAGEEHFMAQIIDISGQRHAQGELARASHLAALGRMAAAVAHDVNNPAAFLQLNLASLQREFAKPEDKRAPMTELTAMLNDCMAGVERIGSIVRELQVFGTGAPTVGDTVDLAEVVRVSCRLASHEVKHHAQLIVDIADDMPNVSGHASQLGQVVTNLVINAARAVGNEAPEANTVNVRCSSDGEMATIQVTDTGPGLPEHPETLFQAFVSGSNSDGHGLGLWICSEIVRQHNGTIQAGNVPEGGARFTVSLPVAAPQSATERPAHATTVGSGRVLVIDDEPAMLRAYQRTLSDSHEVVPEPLATTALERLNRGERFAAIICDIIMPGMTGAQFWDHVSVLDPDQAARVLFVTGGSINESTASFLTTHASRVLRKPLHPSALLSAVGTLSEQS